MSFVITGQQRSGTHLLATLLDSHTELNVFDEYYASANNYVLPTKPLDELKDNEGMIIMYNHMAAQGLKDEVLDVDKIIYLYRENLRDQAYSHLKIRKDGIAHSKKEVSEDIKVGEGEIDDHLESIQFRRDNLRDFLPGDAFWVSYEEITGGEEVQSVELPDMCDYLGVENQKLETNLKKINADSNSS